MYPFASFAPLRVGLAPVVAGMPLALGKAHSCSLDAAVDGIRCRGDNRRGQKTVPALASPTANPRVTALFGADVQNGFDTVALALKHRAEQQP